ncbi:hypothetical protein Tco_0503110 [Tanacetum coccineum]
MIILQGWQAWMMGGMLGKLAWIRGSRSDGPLWHIQLMDMAYLRVSVDTEYPCMQFLVTLAVEQRLHSPATLRGLLDLGIKSLPISFLGSGLVFLLHSGLPLSSSSGLAVRLRSGLPSVAV